MKLSPTMQAAVALATSSGGKLYRHRGGHWTKEPGDREYTTREVLDILKLDVGVFGTRTVEALVKRGAASYTDFKTSWASQFPVEVTVNIND